MSELPTLEKIKQSSKKALTVGAVAVAGFFAFSPSELDIVGTVWGNTTSWRTKADMNKEAQAKYKQVLAKASPSQLFELRYTDFAHIRVARTAIHESGLMSFFGGDSGGIYNDGQHYQIGDGCLNDTAFDINGGSLHFNVEFHGLFSSVDASASGDFPTAAAQASYQPATHELTVRTGNNHPDDLRFAIGGTKLRPEDQHTKDLLATYGCMPQVETSSAVGR
jgi:hypothetical protein